MVSVLFGSSFVTTAGNDVTPSRSYLLVRDDAPSARTEYLAVLYLNFDAGASRAHSGMSVPLLAHIAIVEPALRVLLPQSLRVAPGRVRALVSCAHLDVDALAIAVLAGGPGINHLALVVPLVLAFKLRQ